LSEFKLVKLLFIVVRDTAPLSPDAKLVIVLMLLLLH